MLPGHLVQMEIGGLVQDHICEMIQAFSFVVAFVLAGELEILAVLSSLKMTTELSTFNFMGRLGDSSFLAGKQRIFGTITCVFFFLINLKKC